ncbi:alkene reductase [Dyadobacter sp. CY356]|uniref:alkene reductase n=1 Tax=Dyadobacter sp. CY356 TaxID=2906442 RepID=UPI001F42E539|nr:alkene reductase [Dyadobacter sp. CY356]MCF0054536.1 alkene reductase [Dyadobacter sp. CY356]
MKTINYVNGNLADSRLFTPINLGPITLPHRVVMAPLTRLRSEQPGDIPSDLMAEMYAQRATDQGLVIAEATTVSILGRGYLGAPGIYTDEQVTGWKKVTDAVHAKGGRIFLQLWHVGRQSHVEMTNGQTPVAPSAVQYEQVVITKDGWVPVSPNRALEIEEIPGIVEEFRMGAVRALAAGFDGVELHGANGYLIDEFLQDGTNKRTDKYGGSFENRSRFLMEILEAVIPVWGEGRVGVRLGPSGIWASMSDSDPEALFGYVAEQLNNYPLAYLHIIEPRVVGGEAPVEGRPPVAAVSLRKIYNGTILAAGGFEPDSAKEIIENGDADMVVFGRHFAANPDLPSRIKFGYPLNPYDRDTFWGGDHRGYTDYPFYSEIESEESISK